MSGTFRVSFLVAFFLTLLLPANAGAQWVRGGIITNISGGLESDGANGVIVGGADVKRYNASGIVQWHTLAPWTLNPFSPVAASDGSGGVVMGSHVGGTGGIHATRVTQSGATFWGPYGLQVTNNAVLQTPAISSDGSGGAILVWTRNGANLDLAAQRVSGAGVIQWAVNGLGICLQSGDQKEVAVASDGAGGAIIVWSDQRPGAVGGQDIFAQHVSAAGVPLWTADGMAVCNAAGIQDLPFILSDGAGGAFIAWADQRGGNRDVYVQRVDPSGASLWAANGVLIAGFAGDQLRPTMVSDGATGAVVTWEDGRAGGTDIYAQRLDASGVTQWTAGGAPVCTEAHLQHQPFVIDDQNGGFIVGWSDRRNVSTYDVYVQRLDGSGVPSWTSDGVLVETGSSASTERLDLVADGLGGAYVGVPVVFRLHRVLADGTVAWTQNYQAVWTGIVDEPADQGGFVQLRVNRAPADGGITAPPGTVPPWITDYMVWRRIPSSLAPEAVAATAAARDVVASSVGRSLRLGPSMAMAAGFPPGSWESLGSHVAMQLPSYIFGAPTHDDSTEAGPADDVFVITSHVPANYFVSPATPAFYVVSRPDTGHSVDNIPPGMPQNLAGGTTGMGVYLAWSPRGERDLEGYAVYRGTSPGFTPSVGNRIGSPTSSGFTDPFFDPGVSHYKVSARDIHGNESTFALLTPGEVGDVRPGPIPAVSFLGRPTPNPARSVVAFELGLARAGNVDMAVFDSRGALVRRIVNREMEAGVESIRWDGRDAGGRSVTPGVYWVKLAAPDFKKSERLVWLE